VSNNKYYASIDVLPEKLKEGKGKGLLHLEVVIKIYPVTILLSQPNSWNGCIKR
jgi:hypothetical protein